MYANNEVGTIEPIDEIIKICNDKDVPIHVDAVQALGSLEIDLSDKNIDMMSFSGHKIGAPKGVGILYVRDGFEISPFTVSYTHLTLPTIAAECRSRWSPYH